jgi:hypothetical protein
MTEVNHRRLLVALIVASGVIALLFVLGVGYLVWDILSMYFRMKREGGG